MKTKVQIVDFKLFTDVIKAAAKIVESAKLSINENGLQIYGCRGNLTRCELTTNSIYSAEQVEIYIERLDMFNKILSTICEIHGNDFSDFNFVVDLPKIIFESKKFKTRYQTQDGDLDSIKKWVSDKVKVELVPEFEFTTNSNAIKTINSHVFICQKTEDLRIYLDLHNDMENNALYATLKNKDSDLNTSMTFKFGLVNFGKLSNERKMILDVEHLNLFNAIQSNEIKIFLPEKYNMLVSKVHVNGKNDSYFNMNIYNALLKN